MAENDAAVGVDLGARLKDSLGLTCADQVLQRGLWAFCRFKPPCFSKKARYSFKHSFSNFIMRVQLPKGFNPLPHWGIRRVYKPPRASGCLHGLHVAHWRIWPRQMPYFPFYSKEGGMEVVHDPPLGFINEFNELSQSFLTHFTTSKTQSRTT